MTTMPAVPIAENNFQLTPPDVLQPVSEAAARTALPLSPDLKAAVDEQAARFIDALLTEDLGSDRFKARLDSAFELGKEEISIAASLLQGRFMERNFVGMEKSAAFTAIQDMRSHLEELNPGREGDLLQAKNVRQQTAASGNKSYGVESAARSLL